MINEHEKLKNIFFEEAAELISAAESSLLLLEKDKQNEKIIDQIFRSIHTLKGSGSLFGFENMSSLSHVLEDLLEEVRSKRVPVNDALISTLFKAIDMIKLLVEAEKSGTPASTSNLSELTNKLVELLKSFTYKKGKSITGKKSKKSPKLIGEILINEGAISEAELEKTLEKQNSPIGKILIEEGKINEKQLEETLEKQKNLGITPQTFVRVSAQKLDSLVDLVGELVISHSIIKQSSIVQDIKNQQFIVNLSHLGKVIHNMQDQIMSLRMVPISQTFNRMKRLVRDVSVKLGKKVELIIIGEDTEIDKNIVDDLNEIIVHIVRNAIDHGIEAPEERTQSGKKPVGLLELSAYPKGGNIIIEIRDDGHGLSKEKITKKAKGMKLAFDPDNDFEVQQIIFEPGFSTSEKITDMSGRGVGMDAVKKKLEGIRGKIEVSSEEGKGTVFKIILQPTLAIIDGMVFSVGAERMIIPTLSIEESLRPQKEQVITIKGNTEAVLIRGKVYPLIRLHNIFSIEKASTKPWEALVMLAKSQGRRCVILIDEIIGQQQVVVKSLGEKLQRLKAISGGAILGDGKVGLILDLDGLMDFAQQQTAS